jgi:hypothetical protein
VAAVAEKAAGAAVEATVEAVEAAAEAAAEAEAAEAAVTGDPERPRQLAPKASPGAIEPPQAKPMTLQTVAKMQELQATQPS